MNLTCKDCAITFAVEGDGLFAPRLCEPCRLARVEAADAVLHGDRVAAIESRRKNLLDILALKTPTPSDTARFNVGMWTEIKAWRWRVDKQPILLIYGTTGRGKTRMAAQACIDEVTEASHAVTLDWWGGLELRAAVLATFNRDVASQSLAGLRGQLVRAEWLVIDDWLSHSRATASHGEFLLSVLDERIARRRPTIITMQGQQAGEKRIVIHAIESQFESPLTGEAVARRISQHSTLIQTL